MNRQRLFLLLLAIACAAGTARAASPAARPTEPIDPASCVTAECHADLKTHKVLHGPVTSSACDACHEPADPAAHTFRLAREGAELCTYCHEFKVDHLPVVHKPVTLGECIGCHDPHGGATRALVRDDSMPQLCSRCHESVTLAQKHVHTPVAEGHCDACHSPHAARFPKLVNATGPDLCLACHDNLDRNLATSAVVHKAAQQACDSCHDVHASNQPFALAAAAPQLCYTCHEDTQKQVSQVTHRHSPVTEEQACITCHAAHSSSSPALMKDQPLVVCMSCHTEAIAGVVPAVPEIADPDMHLHGALADGQCSGCHAAHGGDRPMLLVRSFDARMYQTFSPEQYDLCFGCHDQRLAKDADAQGLTGFRDGHRNLHFVHANEGDRGRNCRMCHTPHASRNSMNIRESVAYGKWNMPIGFEQTDTGGSCDPGCHVLYRYDRENPVSPDAAPAPRPYAGAAHLASGASWERTDAAGRTVRVPDPQRPTVLLFVSAHQPHLLDLVASTAAADRAQVILVTGGAEAQEVANAMLTRQAPMWPVVVDADSALAARHAVRGWPATVILYPDGAEAGRIRGTPDVLATRLADLLDLAEGKITPAELEQRIRPPAPPEHLARDTARQLDTARRLLQEGKAEQAQKLLEHALKLQPRSAELQVTMIETLIALDQGTAARSMLARLPQNALPPPRHNVLRAAVHVSLKQWPQARPLVETALREDPDLVEAHLLMARICEHEQNWQQAAQHYRIVHELTRARQQ